jgi:hypothetical protein
LCSPGCGASETCVGGFCLKEPVPTGSGCFCGSVDPNKPCSATTVEVPYEIGGAAKKVSFTFSAPVHCGEFASSAHRGQNSGTRLWVAPKTKGGTLKLIATSPAVSGSGSSTRHGLGHEYTAMNQSYPFTGGVQGFSTANAISLPFQLDTSTLPVNNVGVGAYTIFKGVTHLANAAVDIKCSNVERNCEEVIVPLVLVSSPPGDVFAPPFFGTDKTMWPASIYQPQRLGNAKPVSGVISFAAAHATLKHVKMDNVQYDWNSRESHGGIANYGGTRGYPGYKYQRYWSAVIRMNMAPASVTEARLKEEMGRFMVQQAIDLYAIHVQGAGKGSPNTKCGAYMANGGFGQARLGIFVVGAILGNRTQWLSNVNQTLSTHLGRQCFGETAIVQPPNPAGRNKPLFGTLSSAAHTVYPTNKTAGDPKGWVDNQGNSASPCMNGYHKLNLGTQIGEVLALLAMPDGYALWPKNAKYFFDYVDRSYSGTGKDAYAYCTANSSALTTFSASYMVPGATAAWNANYNLACRKTNTCP